jgi:hypothetical protein
MATIFVFDVELVEKGGYVSRRNISKATRKEGFVRFENYRLLTNACRQSQIKQVGKD